MFEFVQRSTKCSTNSSNIDFSSKVVVLEKYWQLLNRKNIEILSIIYFFWFLCNLRFKNFGYFCSMKNMHFLISGKKGKICSKFARRSLEVRLFLLKRVRVRSTLDNWRSSSLDARQFGVRCNTTWAKILQHFMQSLPSLIGIFLHFYQCEDFFEI